MEPCESSSESDVQVASVTAGVGAKHFRFTDAWLVCNWKELLLADRRLTSIDSLESFKNLKKVELRGFLEMSHSLCWLGLAKNRLRKISGLGNLSSLAVLDLSDNRVSRLVGLEALQGLKALIATRNRIVILDGLSPKKNPLLETLILSHNQIEQCALVGFKNLKKISLAHNQLHAFPTLKKLPVLSELRLNGNKLLAISPAVASLPHLSTLDVGNNLIKQASGFDALRGLLWLTNLNVRGNLSEGDELPDQVRQIVASLQRLEILNGKRQSGKARKRRRQNDRDAQPRRAVGRARGRGASGGRGYAMHGTGRGRGSAHEDSDTELKPLRARGRGGSSVAMTKSHGQGRSATTTSKADEAAGRSPEMPDVAATKKGKKRILKKRRPGKPRPAS
ncbi:inlA [Symbiodinium natans]|uniref:InlA protein n=1 Tax=Symbiodinium natans TaxID=878477 RepID=A0A812I168_9DINO|nr:inlA [Symbiodinium natans]